MLGTVEVAARAGSFGNVAQCNMRWGANSLNYNLYANPARSIVSGDGTTGAETITRSRNGLLIFERTAVFNGRNAARQWASAGTNTVVIVNMVTY